MYIWRDSFIGTFIGTLSTATSCWTPPSFASTSDLSTVTMDYLNILPAYLRDIKPSQYGYILPLYDRVELDKLALTGQFPSLNGLTNSLLVAAVLGVSRLILTYTVMKPLAMSVLKIKIKIKKQEYQPAIEDLITAKGAANKIKLEDVREFLKDDRRTGCLTETDVLEYLWNTRRNISAEKKIVKFVEALWRFIFYSYFCFVGYRALFVPNTVSWVLNTKDHWQDWPLQPITDAISFYYQIELGAYIHQIMWTEVARSDSLEMVIHHLATILLILGSYLTNFTRIGASILLLHDSSDVFLESAKVFVYISKSKGGKWACNFCDTLFALFAVSFLITRLIIYPRYLVYSLIYEAPEAMGPWPGYPIFAGLLIVLQCLHIFWFYLILRMIPSLLSTGIQKDERSDDEGDIDGYAPEEEVKEREREKLIDGNEKTTALVDKDDKIGSKKSHKCK